MNVAASGLARGTHVLARKGEKPVEALTRSDMLVGMTRVAGRIALKSQPPSVDWSAADEPVTAVRILAGAVGVGVPARDLVVRAGQRLLVGETLIPARLLVNGATIRRDAAMPRAFVAVSLPVPALVMADGIYVASAEVTSAEHTGHALASSGPALETARETLLARARAMGYAPVRDADLGLSAGGQLFKPSQLDPVTWRFALPRPADDAWLVSRAVVPQERLPLGGDPRRLGVMVETIALDRAPFSLDDPALTDGWYPREADERSTWRWTDGHARLPAGFRSLVVKVPFLETYWLDPDGQAVTPELPWAPADEPEAVVPANPEVEQDLVLVRDSGLVDADWYRAEYGDIAELGLDPVWHFVDRGWAEGRRPNPYFDVAWYASENREAISDGRNPLLHYIREGERAGRRPALQFEPAWYRRAYGLGEDASPLAHWLAHRRTTQFSPIPEFDVQYYCWTGRDMPGSDLDPFEHYLAQGWKEGRNPSAQFETMFYARRYAAQIGAEHPFLHYLANRDRMTLQANVREGVNHDVTAAARAGQKMFAFPFIWYLGNWTGYEPLVAFAADPELQHPFCIVWKNERLVHEGDPASLQTEALKAYRYEADNDEFIVQKMAYFFDDARYLRRDGRPVILFELPAPSLDAKLATSRWTSLFTLNHKVTPLFVMTDRAL